MCNVDIGGIETQQNDFQNDLSHPSFNYFIPRLIRTDALYTEQLKTNKNFMQLCFVTTSPATGTILSLKLGSV